MENASGLAMWEKQDKNGNLYFYVKATIDGKSMSFYVFKNRDKKEPKYPDWKSSKPMTGEAPQKKQAETFTDDVPF